MTDSALSPSVAHHTSATLMHDSMHTNSSTLHDLHGLVTLHDGSHVVSSGGSSTHEIQHQHQVSSPATSHDLNFMPLSPSLYHSASGHHGPPSTASTSSSSSANGGTLHHSRSAMMQSPSGDVYLDGSVGGLGLDSMPLVAGMEGRVHSPALSDLVAAGTLLPWSPRSADSMMAPSPSIHDALSANMGLDVAHSSDTLCDSSTHFPGLFSIEGDAASVSSSASEDLVSYQTDHHRQDALPQRAESPRSNDLLREDSANDDNMIVFTSTSLPSPVLLTANQDQTVSSSKFDRSRIRGLTSSGDGGSLLAEIPPRETPWRFESVVINTMRASSPTPTVTLPRSSLMSSLLNEDTKDAPEVVVEDTENGSDDKTVLEQKFDSVSDNQRTHRKYRMSGKVGASSMSNSSHNGRDEGSEDNNVKTELFPGSIIVGRSRRNASPNIPEPQIKGGVKEEEKDSSENDFRTSKSKETKDSKIDRPIIKDWKRVKIEDEQCHLGRGRRSVTRKRRSVEMSSASEEQRSSSDLKHVKDVVPVCDDDSNSAGLLSVTHPILTRARHASSNSDCSSTGSSFMDQNQSSFLDSPAATFSGGKRRRCVATGGCAGSRESSVSSRDDSPAPVMSSPIPPQEAGVGMTTRRASNRDHAKKTRCSCCIGDSSTSSSSAHGRVAGHSIACSSATSARSTVTSPLHSPSAVIGYKRSSTPAVTVPTSRRTSARTGKVTDASKDKGK